MSLILRFYPLPLPKKIVARHPDIYESFVTKELVDKLRNCAETDAQRKHCDLWEAHIGCLYAFEGTIESSD